MINKMKSTANALSLYDFHDEGSDIDADQDLKDSDDSDEDTEDASETDMIKKEEEYTEIKEQMYQDKLANLKKQLRQLEEGTLPEYQKRLKKIENQYKERLRLNEVFQEVEEENIEHDYVAEKKESVREFEDKKVELKENLIIELEDKKKQIENERLSMELTGDSMEIKPISTRKLRRRPNDPLPMDANNKRRKTVPAQINTLLSEVAVYEDLRIINKGKLPNLKRNTTNSADSYANDVRFEDGKLFFEKRWFHRGQPIYLESRETGKINGVISAIGPQEIWVRRTLDSSKLRVTIQQLQKEYKILH